MRDLAEYSGINVFIGTPTSLHQIPAANRANAIFMHFNNLSKLIETVYYDALGNAIRIPHENQDINESIGKLSLLAKKRGVDLDLESAQMLHLNPTQIQEVFPSLLDNYIYTEEKYAQIFFDNHPNEKFSRKTSGLEHSYINDAEEGIVQLTNKTEIRVMWSKTIPTQNIFANLPDNTSGAYVVVQPQKDVSPVLYYLDKKDGAVAQEVTKKPDLVFFNAYRFNNQGLSKEDLEYIPKTLHQTDKTNVYGSGGMARVKKSTVKTAVSTKFATKIQKLKKEGRFKSQKGSARDSQITRIQKEARILSDLQLGSADVQISGDKAYMQMQAKGTPLSKKLASATSSQKLDYAIKFLISVDRLHTGTGPVERSSLTHTPYAHRDLKPANVLVDEFGELTLIDYGLSTPNITNKTEESGGTLFYAPLDQNIINYYSKTDFPQIYETSNSPELAKNDSKISIDDELEDWTTDVETDELTKDVQTEKVQSTEDKSSLPPNWNFCLGDPEICLTANYLEDDKIAALRTIYTSCPIATEEDSIFNDEDFADLPEPIREILNTDTIAPLLSPERRQETESFFAAVLIMYQKNPNKKNEEYKSMIEGLRQHPALQQAEITAYLDDQEHTLERRNKSPTSVVAIESEELIDQKIHTMRKLKAKLPSFTEGTFGEKKTVWQKFKQKIMGRSSGSITPIDSESEKHIENEDQKKKTGHGPNSSR